MVKIKGPGFRLKQSRKLEMDSTDSETWIRLALPEMKKSDAQRMDGSEGENLLIGVGK